MATISEIAAAAGVGVTTVSRYLNHHPYISADKKARIEAAIKTLGYTPSAAATSLRAIVTGNLAVLERWLKGQPKLSFVKPRAEIGRAHV